MDSASFCHESIPALFWRSRQGHLPSRWVGHGLFRAELRPLPSCLAGNHPTCNPALAQRAGALFLRIQQGPLPSPPGAAGDSVIFLLGTHSLRSGRGSQHLFPVRHRPHPPRAQAPFRSDGDQPAGAKRQGGGFRLRSSLDVPMGFCIPHNPDQSVFNHNTTKRILGKALRREGYVHIFIG